MNDKQIAVYIKKRRKQLSITQKELSLLSGVNIRYRDLKWWYNGGDTK